MSYRREVLGSSGSTRRWTAYYVGDDFEMAYRRPA